MQKNFQYGVLGKKFEAEDGKEIYPFIISSENVDRVGDKMEISGGRFEHFVANPVVHYNHKTTDLPIGVCVGLKAVFQNGNWELHAETHFHEQTEESKVVKKLVDAGVLKTASIGFYPIRTVEEPVPFELAEDFKSRFPWRNGINVFKEWELLEYSIVNIPANTDALALKTLNEQEYKLFTEKIGQFSEDKEIETTERVIWKIGAELSRKNKSSLEQVVADAQNIINTVSTILKIDEEGEDEKSANELVEPEQVEETEKEVELTEDEKKEIIKSTIIYLTKTGE